MDIEQRAAAVIQQYEAQGWHRTGTRVDRASAEWLAGLVNDAGLEPVLTPVTLERIELIECYLDVDGRRIEGVPLFDCAYTDAAGIDGALALAGEAAAGGIAVMRTAPNGSPDDLLALRAGNVSAIIAVTEGGAPGLALLNAPAFVAPFGPPVLQVSSDEGDWLTAAAERGVTARLVAQIERRSEQTFNVTAVAGSGPFVLGVNTPRSGWWQCAGERGGGLVCWLETLRAVAALDDLPGSVFFSATTGHELGHLGFDRLLSERVDLAGIPQWIHFGANLGCTSATEGRLMASDEVIAKRTEEAVARHRARSMQTAIGPSGGGEMKTAREHGATRWVALTNDNAHFHMTSDRFDLNVSPREVAAYASAFSDMAVTSLRMGRQT